MKGFRSSQGSGGSEGSAGSGVLRFGESVLPGLIAAVGLWLSLGVVSPLAGSSADRIGALAPVWVLLACLVVVGLLAAGLDKERARVLYLGAVAGLPWLPGRIAAFLIWQGPIVWALWAGILLVLVWPWLERVGARALGVDAVGAAPPRDRDRSGDLPGRSVADGARAARR